MSWSTKTEILFSPNARAVCNLVFKNNFFCYQPVVMVWVALDRGSVSVDGRLVCCSLHIHHYRASTINQIFIPTVFLRSYASIPFTCRFFPSLFVIAIVSPCLASLLRNLDLDLDLDSMLELKKRERAEIWTAGPWSGNLLCWPLDHATPRFFPINLK